MATRVHAAPRVLLAPRAFSVLHLAHARGLPPALSSHRCAHVRVASSKAGDGGGKLVVQHPGPTSPAPVSPPSPSDIVVKTASGGEVVIPGRAAAGLSAEFRSDLIDRARRGRELPVIYENPGSHSQLDRVPQAVLAALPPPRRPLWPLEERVRTWHLLRAFSIGMVFVGLAGYLHLKATVKGSARLSLERTSPRTARALVALGIIQDMEEMEQELDRGLLFSRVFERYTPGGGGAGGGMPAPRAIRLLQALLGEPTEGGAGEALRAAAAAAGVPLSGTLSSSQFVSLACATASGLSNPITHLTCEEVFGVAALPKPVLDLLGECYDRVVVARGAGRVFTPTALSELAHEIGFSGDEGAAEAFLKDTVAVATGLVALPEVEEVAASTGARGGAPPPPAAPSFAVPLSRAEFVDYMAGAAVGAAVSPSRIPEYLRVFYMLHLSGIREAAGVRPVR